MVCSSFHFDILPMAFSQGIPTLTSGVAPSLRLASLGFRPPGLTASPELQIPLAQRHVHSLRRCCLGHG